MSHPIFATDSAPIQEPEGIFPPGLWAKFTEQDAAEIWAMEVAQAQAQGRAPSIAGAIWLALCDGYFTAMPEGEAAQ